MRVPLRRPPCQWKPITMEREKSGERKTNSQLWEVWCFPAEQCRP